MTDAQKMVPQEYVSVVKESCRTVGFFVTPDSFVTDPWRSFENELLTLVSLYFHRIRYGGYSAVGGGVFSHSRGRHLLPRSGCRVQWIRHLRYYNPAPKTHLCFVLNLRPLVWLCTKPKSWGFCLKLEADENTHTHFSRVPLSLHSSSFGLWKTCLKNEMQYYFSFGCAAVYMH